MKIDRIAAAPFFAALVATLLAGCQASPAPRPAPADEALEHAQRLLHDPGTILIDGHNDLPWAIRTAKVSPGSVEAYDLRATAPGMTDLARLRAGGLGGQFWSVYTPGESPGGFARTQLEQIDLARRMIERYPEAFELCGTAAELRAARARGHIGSMLGIEGGHAIENSLGALRAYYALGVRYMTLTHNVHTDWADSAAQTPPRHHGLNAFGERVVHEMNRLGMLVDLSHTSVETMDDALRASKAPVIFSHSNAKAISPVPRNVPDDILVRLRDNGGIVMVSFVAGFADPEVAKIQQPAIDEYNRRSRGLDEKRQNHLFHEIFDTLKLPPTSIGRVADHIDYIRKVAGVEHIGIGSDFDGNDAWPVGLSDVSMYPNLFAELIRRGWTDADLRLVAGGNLLRVLEQAEAVAAQLQKSEPAGTAVLAP